MSSADERRRADVALEDLEHQLELACSSFSLALFVDAMRPWSLATFGTGERTAQTIAHLRKEIAEVERAPSDITEWVDIILLAIDGARRSAYATGSELVAAMVSKQVENSRRTWPDWRTVPEDEPIEHVRESASPPTADAWRNRALALLKIIESTGGFLSMDDQATLREVRAARDRR